MFAQNVVKWFKVVVNPIATDALAKVLVIFGKTWVKQVQPVGNAATVV
ncbi:MAG: hypothetical protein IJT04_01915 [Bacteroidales bacterium]|nr:hypothetical protein [Bacteroidales bacterium]